MYRKKNISLIFSIFAVAFIFALSISGQALAVTYTGSINAGAGGGIIASDGWNTSSTILSWTVQDVGSSGGFILWQYDYNFTVPAKNISHVIIEVSPESQNGDFTILTGSSLGVNDYDGQGNSNPNIPEMMRGIKFGPDGLNYSLSFTTTRSPIWGDFYAKDGTSEEVWVTAWNAGFTASDTDPIAGPQNGSVDFHILRPDTDGATVVPEPVSTVLFLTGGATLTLRRFTRRKK